MLALRTGKVAAWRIAHLVTVGVRVRDRVRVRVSTTNSTAEDCAPRS